MGKLILAILAAALVFGAPAAFACQGDSCATADGGCGASCIAAQ